MTAGGLATGLDCRLEEMVRRRSGGVIVAANPFLGPAELLGRLVEVKWNASSGGCASSSSATNGTSIGIVKAAVGGGRLTDLTTSGHTLPGKRFGRWSAHSGSGSSCGGRVEGGSPAAAASIAAASSLSTSTSAAAAVGEISKAGAIRHLLGGCGEIIFAFDVHGARTTSSSGSGAVVFPLDGHGAGSIQF